MFFKSYILLLLLGLSVAFPQEAAKAEVLENADSKVETTAEPLMEDLVTEPEGDLSESKTVEAKGIEEKQKGREGAEAETEGDFLVGKEILEGEIVPEDEVEYTCEYTDSSQTSLTIRFVKDEEGVEHALDIDVDGAETENIDEKLKECLEQDLGGRRNIKGVKRRKGGKRRRGASAILLRELRRKISGNPRTVTMKEMKSAIRLAQRFMAVKGKEARRRKVLRKKAMGKKRRKAQKKNVKG
ncbi:UNVERIFIED_CONTAM: hypothetical protein RMT77_017452 [Armadillidium vulgare]